MSMLDPIKEIDGVVLDSSHGFFWRICRWQTFLVLILFSGFMAAFSNNNSPPEAFIITISFICVQLGLAISIPTIIRFKDNKQHSIGLSSVVACASWLIGYAMPIVIVRQALDGEVTGGGLVSVLFPVAAYKITRSVAGFSSVFWKNQGQEKKGRQMKSLDQFSQEFTEKSISKSVSMQAIEENSSRLVNDFRVELPPKVNVSRGARSNNNAIVCFCFAAIIGLLAWSIYSHYYFKERIDDVAYDTWQVKRDLDDKHNDLIRYTDKEISKLSDDCKEKCSSLEDAIGWVKSDQRRLESSIEDREEPLVERKPLFGDSSSPRQSNNVYSPPLPPLSPDDDINVELEECNKAEIAMVSNLMSTFLYANEKGDESIFRRIYADTVSYCYKKDSKASKEYIINELRELWRKWPVRSYKVIDAKFKKRRTDKYYVTANVTFQYKNGSRSISGDVEYWIFFEYIHGKGFRMTVFDETVKMHKRK